MVFSSPHFKIFKFNHDLLTLQTFRQSPFASQKQGIFSSPFWAPNAETANIADIGNVRRENPSLKSVLAWPVVGQLWLEETWAKFGSLDLCLMNFSEIRGHYVTPTSNNAIVIREILHWLVVSTPLKNISQIGNLPQLGVKIKNIWNHGFASSLIPHSPP